VNITTDKVYENNEWVWGYRETDPLDGFDPYSNSKSCSELVTHSYQKSFFQDGHAAISTARAGNVIGGGDFANDRIIPDAVRAALNNETIIVRNPYSVRPYQHVLEPLFAYLLIAREQYENADLAGAYNVGPDECDCITTGELTTLFCKNWGEGITWENRFQGGPHEANFLKLDCSKLKTVFDWKPVWHVEKAVEQTVKWTKAYRDGYNITKLMEKQIQEFFKDASGNISVKDRKKYAGKKDRGTIAERNIEIGF
jgi:CDP-glucose 4,6-dehydratase